MPQGMIVVLYTNVLSMSLIKQLVSVVGRCARVNNTGRGRFPTHAHPGTSKQMSTNTPALAGADLTRSWTARMTNSRPIVERSVNP